MPPSLLLTQCLQNDFVQPIGRFDPLPNGLHVGYREALRLMGERPSDGPIARTMRWAHSLPEDRLRLIHIRDWHEGADGAQRDHLEQFGKHCIAGTPGAAFVFEETGDSRATVVDSLTLNDFEGTCLRQVLDPVASMDCRVGVIGVWTEAKVTFLAYELRTRYPRFQVAVCSALTASSSRQRHFQALEQLDRILGVRVYDSVGEFMHFLTGDAVGLQPTPLRAKSPRVEVDGITLQETDEALVRHLFGDCTRVQLRALDGGFSGNVVAGARSVDMHGHEQVPHVVKIGPRSSMGQERAAFERVQDVLGNNAPHISDFADIGDRGAIKYRYASMGGAFSTTFQKQYAAGLALDGIQRVLDTVFGEQLMRLYKAATPESADLLAHYGFSPRWASNVRQRVESLLGCAASGPTLELLPGHRITNVCDFYESTLARLPRRPGDTFYQAYVHGDLNGANIILDGHHNVWLIDFFHTRRAHVLMDLIKLENDLLYIFTALADEAELREACGLTDALLAVEDLAAPLAEQPPSALPQLARAWATVRILRSYYPALVHADRDPLQLWVGQLRYAVHTLGFDESSQLQRKWALYTAAACADRVTRALRHTSTLRVDWLDTRHTAPGKLGMTLLPGRKDYGRDLADDVRVLVDEGVGRVLCLVPAEELERYGVGDLLARYAERGLQVHHLPILDQKVSSRADMHAAVRWLEEGVTRGDRVVVHCVGGLGRSGMAVAAWLRSRGMSAEDALAEVRRARSPRAVETAVQESFVREFVGG